MSKKSYKRNQNRLYREIKRRIIAEQKLLKPMKFATCERKIEMIKIKNMVPNYYAQHVDFIRYDMAMQITSKLIEDSFVEFRSKGFDYNAPLADVTEVEARLYVVRPVELC